MTTKDAIPSLLAQAVALHQGGHTAEAAQIYDAVLKLEPRNGNALNLKAVTLADQGRNEEALRFYDRAAKALPAFPDIPFNKANALAALGRHAQALEFYRRAIALQPDHGDARLNIGLALHRAGKRDDAITAFRQMIAACPTDARGHYNLGVCLTEALAVHTGDRGPLVEEGRRLFEKCLALNPTYAEGQNAYANFLFQEGEHIAAAARGRRAVALKPDWAEAWMNLGGYLEGLGDVDGALAAYDRTLELEPGRIAAVINRGICQLAAGKLNIGWQGYARRFDDPKAPFTPRRWPWPRWQGEPLAGKRILFWSDQGIGDEIMYASMIPEVMALGAQCVLECAPRLVPLYRRSFPGLEIIANEPAGHKDLLARTFDFQSSILDLGGYRRTSFRAFANTLSYLRADERLIARLRAHYQATAPGAKLVGLSWRSANPTIGREKSLDLLDFRPLAENTGAIFVALQYGEVDAEVAAFAAATGKTILRDPAVDSLKDLDTFAAQIAALDLVVSVSNSTAHLAGALGVPTALYVPQGKRGPWYWQKAGAHASWYPSLRIHRNSVGAFVGDIRQILLA